MEISLENLYVDIGLSDAIFRLTNHLSNGHRWPLKCIGCSSTNHYFFLTMPILIG